MSYDQPAERIGVLLAAGRGRRMGRTKQLVAWQSGEGSKPLVAAAFDAIRDICHKMVVVLGHEVDAVVAALDARSFKRVQSNPDGPMIDSICAGLEAARLIAPGAMIVLQPADHPEVTTNTLNILTYWSLQCPAQAIIPVYRNQGGHPVLIPPTVAARILDDRCPSGLSEFWKAHAEMCVRVAVNDPGVCRDIDTPADLAN